MNEKKQIIRLVTVLLIGIIIGGVSIFIIISGGKLTSTGTTVDSAEGDKQLYSCGMHPDVISDKPGNCPICGMKLTPIKGSGSGNETSANSKKKILYWQAPMDPTYISDKPGKSPMGMDLIPVYEGEEGGGAGSILIDPVMVQNMGIKTEPVQRKDLQKTIRAVGIITYNEEKLFTVNSKFSGWIEKLYVNYTGQIVKKGDPFFEIYSPDLVTAQEEYLLALKNKESLQASSFEEIRKGAQTLLASTRKRLENWDIPAAEIDRIEQRGRIAKTMTLTVPVNGVVIHKNAVEGTVVKEGMNLYQIADLSTVWIEASIYEYELPWVNVGQAANMELTYIPEKKFSGKVSYIYPYLDPKTRNVKVRLEFPNPDQELKPDMYANIIIEVDANKKVLVIPNQAVIRSGVRNVVFIEREEGKFEPREVALGIEGEDDYIQVVSGLMEGERIVTSGQFLLDSESNTQAAINKMLDAKRQISSITKQIGEEAGVKETELAREYEHKMKSETTKYEFHQKEKDDSNYSSALYTCPMHPEFTTDDPNQRCPICEMKVEKKKDLKTGTQLYTCPMHPEFVTDDPEGRCSICEMKLVKK